MALTWPKQLASQNGERSAGLGGHPGHVSTLIAKYILQAAKHTRMSKSEPIPSSSSIAPFGAKALNHVKP